MTFLLSAEDSRRTDQLAARLGIESFTLMQNAGRRAAQIIRRYYDPCRVHILCGSGNNGGDGFITAIYLLQYGFDVRIFLLGKRHDLKNDAALAAALWQGKTYPLDSDHSRAELIIDALFGTGLTRPLEGVAASIVQTIAQTTFAPTVALDMPSGVNCDDGQELGVAFRADHTIAFAYPHPGHFLLPGRLNCGQIHVADIGILDQALTELREIAPQCWLNHPLYWRDIFEPPDLPAHKYQRGHATICAGDPQKGGAAKLAARAAGRIGAGLVTLNCSKDWMQIHAAQLMSIMCEEDDIAIVLKDPRRTAALIGPGYGLTKEKSMQQVLALLKTAAHATHVAHAVLDADALTAFEQQSEILFAAIKNKSEGVVVLTPHEGEYQRLFPDLADQSKLIRAQKAAQRSGAIIVLKGADTIIASPEGNVVINANAPSWLATAGTGDVLAGMITGLLAQKKSPFESVCAACFLHGHLGQIAGRGLMAEDLPDLIPEALEDITQDIVKDISNE